MAKVYDIIVWGSTGFTGRLTCEYLHKTYPDLKWAIAGRNEAVMKELKKTLQLRESVQVLVADLADAASLVALTKQTKVLLSTAGPYAKIGAPIVAACVAGEAHYCDLTGEAPFIRQMVDKHFDEAQQKKLKIVHCCGFDCIPCDLGTQMIVEEAQRRGCTNIQEVRFLADKMKGGASGGTLASVFNIFESLSMKELLELLNPFYLNPREVSTNKVEAPHDNKALLAQSADCKFMGYDKVTGSWTMPYLMQAVDTRLVNRSNAVSGFKYGRTFVFSERMVVPNMIVALLGSVALSVFQLMVVLPFTRFFIKKVVPQPGQGPSQDMLDNGFFTAKLWAKALHPATGQEVLVQASVQAFNGDPGYRQTAKMIAESAVCLAQDGAKLPACYGVITPSTAMGGVLRERLVARGIQFKIDA